MSRWLRNLLARLALAVQRWTEIRHPDVDETPPVAPPVTPATTEGGEPPLPIEGDDLNLAKVTAWIVDGKAPAHKLLAARVTASIHEAWTDGRMLHTRFDPYPWREAPGSGVDSICYFFYDAGHEFTTGGKFDWWRSSGQPSKTLENVRDGYPDGRGHRMPSPGTKCWTMISSKDGTQRSNTCRVHWR